MITLWRGRTSTTHDLVCLLSSPTLLPAQDRDITSSLTNLQAHLGGCDSIMLSTKTRNAFFRSIFSEIQINHAAPINEQESRRLLKALTASFRKNLDEEHGRWSEDARLPRTRLCPHPPPPAVDKSPYRPTDRHVRAVLSNPLFSYDPTKNTSKPADTSDPMAVFDQAVAKGLMTPARAAGILIAQRSLARSLSDNTSPPSSDTGLRVVQWLRSSGLERDLSFITDHRLLKPLVIFMTEERLDEIVWTWLERWMYGRGPPLPLYAQVFHASHLLSLLIRAKAPLLTNLDNGYASMVRADDMFSHLRDFEQVAIHPWQYLSAQSTVGSGRPRPSVVLFDSFAAISEHLQSNPSLELHKAHLDLYHPTHPDVTLAMDFFKSPLPQSLDLCLQQEINQGVQTRQHTTVLRKLISMATDTAGHLARTGREVDAEWVRDLLRTFRITQVKHSAFHYHSTPAI